MDTLFIYRVCYICFISVTW